MQQKVNPAIIGVAVVILLAFCIFMYVRSQSGGGPTQLPPPSDTYKPGYTGGGSRRPPPGSASSGAQTGGTGQ